MENLVLSGKKNINKSKLYETKGEGAPNSAAAVNESDGNYQG